MTDNSNTTLKTYRDYGWQEPKFTFGQTVQLIHQSNDLIKDMRICVVVNYWRAYNGEFGYNVVPAPGEDTSKDEDEGFEHWESELEPVPMPQAMKDEIERKAKSLLDTPDLT